MVGIDVWNAPGANISIGNDSSNNPTEITNATIGIFFSYDDPIFGEASGNNTLNVSGAMINDTPTGIDVGDYPYYSGSVAGNVVLNLSGGSITGATTGLEVDGQTSGSYTATVNVQSVPLFPTGPRAFCLMGRKPPPRSAVQRFPATRRASTLKAAA